MLWENPAAEHALKSRWSRRMEKKKNLPRSHTYTGQFGITSTKSDLSWQKMPPYVRAGSGVNSDTAQSQSQLGQSLTGHTSIPTTLTKPQKKSYTNVH